MGWTTLANSTTADATEVDGSLRHIGEGTLLPRSGTAMAATDAALDLGNTATSWRDVHLDRDLYARSIRGQANFAGYIEWSSSPFTSVFGSVTANSGPVVIIPPFKAEINGQTYVHAATTTLDFATTTSWLSGQSGMTASTFVWVYAVPTTTGDAVVRLDDINPSQTFSTITGGLYHISTTSNPSRAIHAMRINSSNIMLRYHRTGNDIRYIPHSTTAIPSSDGISHSTWSSVITFSDIPNFLRTRRIYTNFDYFKSTLMVCMALYVVWDG